MIAAHHTPGLIAAHLQFVNDAAMPFLRWIENGHQWAEALGLAWLFALLIWPFLLTVVVLAIWAELTNRQIATAGRRWEHRRLRARA